MTSVTEGEQPYPQSVPADALHRPPQPLGNPCPSVSIRGFPPNRAGRFTGRVHQAARVAFLALVSSWFVVAQSSEVPAGHRFAATDYVQGRVVLISAQGTVEWEYPASNANDLWVLPNGNLLFNTGHGVREVTRAKEVVFDYQSKSEIYACQRLTNGNTFIGECNAGRLLEVEPSGRIAKEIRLLPEGRDGGHAYMRNARRLPDGHYLVAHYGEQVVREYDGEGRVVRAIPAAGGPHSVVRLSLIHI